jgi:hypothetical protein
MKWCMTAQVTGDCWIEVTTYAGLTVIRFVFLVDKMIVVKNVFIVMSVTFT